MKTLAEFKRSLTIGSKWHCYHELHHCTYGEREVVFKDTVKVGFKIYDGLLKDSDRVSYLYFPKADLVEFKDNEIRIFWPASEAYEKLRRHVLTYKKVEAV